MEEILEDEEDGNEPDNCFDDAADQIQHQLARGVGLFVLSSEMLRPCVVDGVDDAEDPRKEDNDEKGEENLVDDAVDLAWKMNEAVAKNKGRQQSRFFVCFLIAHGFAP